MKNYVVTIAREYGSGGRTLGEMLSKKLGIEYYDKNIMRMASDESGINEELFGRVDEYSTAKQPLFGKSGIYTGEILEPSDKRFTSDPNLFAYQAKIIKQLASTRDCVIIGRCANRILTPEEYPNVLRVFVHGSWDFRMEEAAKKLGKSSKELEKFLKKDDQRKQEFCLRYTGVDWSDPSNYDLYIDNSVLGYEGSLAEIEKHYLALKEK